MSHDSVNVYVHEPVAPFIQIAGPISPVAGSVRKTVALSKDSSASFNLSAGDLENPSWLLPGMCWRIDQSYLGEPVWAGFVAPQTISLRAEDFTVSLVGPKDGLLQQPLAAEFPSVLSPESAVRSALIAAQTLGSPMLEGEFNDDSPTLPLAVRGDAASSFITAMQRVSASDYRERVILENNSLEFYLDFGRIQNDQSIVIGDEDLVDGSFTADRIPSTFTAFGAAAAFSSRESVSISPSQATTGPGSSSELAASAKYQNLLALRAIGPAAIKHATAIQERFDKGLIGLAAKQHDALLRFVDEYVLIVSNTANARRVQLGDVITLRVSDWCQSLDVDVRLHIREITPNDSDATRSIVGSVLF